MKLKALVLFTSALLCVAPVLGATQGGGYQGIEFFGSSLVTRQELEKGLGLKPGASYASVVKAVEKLQQSLEKRRIKSNIDIANDDSGVVVTIDVMEGGASGIPIRKLDSPHHVVLSSEVPFQIFDELMARRETLAQQGRPVKEEYPDGVKKFSDEPCNQYADKLLVRVPDMTNEFLSVIASDPNGMRRSKAIEVLNWAGNYPDLCYRLLPALNDASEQVRASAARFIFPRIRMLPENFPFEDLVEVFSLQLSRPSHIDRLLALRCLIETARTHQITLYAIKEYDMERLKQLDSMSIVESIQKPAHQLVQILASLPDKPTPKRPSPINEF